MMKPRPRTATASIASIFLLAIIGCSILQSFSSHFSTNNSSQNSHVSRTLQDDDDNNSNNNQLDSRIINIQPYSIQNVLAALPFWKNTMGVMIYDPETDKFILYYAKEMRWISACNKVSFFSMGAYI